MIASFRSGFSSSSLGIVAFPSFLWVFGIGKAFVAAAVHEVPLLNRPMEFYVSGAVEIFDCVHCLSTTF
jgi:cellobiose-specific phosphotransferase system component IIC